MLDSLLTKLLAECAVIKQAPLTFIFVWAVGALVTYITIKRSFRSQLNDFRNWLGDRDSVITFLEKKLELQQKVLDLQPTVPAEPRAISDTSVGVPELKAEKQLLPPVLELMHFD